MGTRRKRADHAPATSGGYSVLVERLWPRGVPKTDAEIDEWAHAVKLRELPRRARKVRLTLVYSDRDEEHHDAVLPIERPRRGRRSV
jgi:uncharacterized protein YeaO (DUF488 family)